MKDDKNSSYINSNRIMTSKEQGELSRFGPVAVSISYEGESKSHLTQAAKVEEILEDLEISYKKDDIVLPAPDEYVADSVNIRIIRVENSIATETTTIPYETVYIEDDTLDLGKEIVMQEGEDGVLTTTYTLRYEDGTLVEKTETGETITTQPINEIITKGTKKPLPVVIDDRRCDYWYTVVDQKTENEYERAWLKYVMWKESRCNASNNYNPIYKGLFQFHPSTYSAYGGTDIWNGEQQISVTLYMIRIPYGCNHWNYCPEGNR